jgi:hypothetical protein
MGVAVDDYDNDGYERPLRNRPRGKKLYHNNGNGTFTNVTETANVSGAGWSTSAALVDLDNDGLLGLVVLRYVQRDQGYGSYWYPDMFQLIAPLVFHNDGNGHFTEVSQKLGVALPEPGDSDRRLGAGHGGRCRPEKLQNTKVEFPEP